MSDTTTKDSPLARLSLGLCAIWLAAGAFAKLVWGSPALLPEVIRKPVPIDLWDLSYTLVIGIELSLVALAFLRPRLAWPAMVALFVFFDFVLTTQIAAGAESCGCFGGGLKVSPKLMMAVDSALLLFLLATKPWISIKRGGAGIGLVLGSWILAFALPAVWIRVRQSEAPVNPPTANGTTPPVKAPAWLTLDPAKWVGQSVYDIAELTKWVEAEKLPTDGEIVLWRKSCDHCAKHLREMANGDKGDHPILLIQIQDDVEATSLVDALPSGAHVTTAEFPLGMQVVLETPWELTVAGGNVTTARDRKALEEAPK
jgi:hypothetical protein